MAFGVPARRVQLALILFALVPQVGGTAFAQNNPAPTNPTDPMQTPGQPPANPGQKQPVPVPGQNPTGPQPANPATPGGTQVGAKQTAPTTQPGSNPPPLTLTLDQAIDVGLRNSKGLAISAEAVNRARGRVNENRAGFNPGASGNFVFTHLDEGSTITFPGPNGQPQTIPIVRQDQKTLSVGATLPIDIVGLIRTAVQQAQFQEIAARLDFNRTRNDLVLNIRGAYYDVLRARAQVRVAETALRNAQDQQATAEAQLRAGTGTRFDVLRAQTTVANAQQNVIAARNQVNLATATLNNVLGLDQNTPTQTVETSNAAPPSVDFNGEVSTAYQTRPEVLEADANIRAAEKGVTLARRSYLPTLGLGVNFNYTPDAGGFAPKTTAWAATATVSFPIFDQGLSAARVQQARADVNTARINKQVTLDTVALQVRQAYLALIEAQDRLNVTTAGLAQAEEQYRLAQVRFRAGVTAVPGGSPLLEVSDALNALVQAQTNQVNAQYDVQTARARLDQAVGRYAFNGAARPGLPAPIPVGGKK